MGKYNKVMKNNLIRNKAFFLDRDGVINKTIIKEGKPYPPSNLKELKICEGVEEGLKLLKSKGFFLIVVTNQPDASRGKTSIDKIKAINNHLMKLLPLDEINTCFHDNKDNCSCRKPQPGMILNSAKKRNIDLSKSYIIGDRKSDIEAGKLAGCKTIFIDYKYEESKPTEYDFKVTSLLMAAMYI
jgi:D-glycero-D-manno-heptose 1,7-bisphosphate phosphatase